MPRETHGSENVSLTSNKAAEFQKSSQSISICVWHTEVLGLSGNPELRPGLATKVTEASSRPTCGQGGWQHSECCRSHLHEPRPFPVQAWPACSPFRWLSKAWYLQIFGTPIELVVLVVDKGDEG